MDVSSKETSMFFNLISAHKNWTIVENVKLLQNIFEVRAEAIFFQEWLILWVNHEISHLPWRAVPGKTPIH